MDLCPTLWPRHVVIEQQVHRQLTVYPLSKLINMSLGSCAPSTRNGSPFFRHRFSASFSLLLRTSDIIPSFTINLTRPRLVFGSLGFNSSHQIKLSVFVRSFFRPFFISNAGTLFLHRLEGKKIGISVSALSRFASCACASFPLPAPRSGTFFFHSRVDSGIGNRRVQPVFAFRDRDPRGGSVDGSDRSPREIPLNN